MGTDDAKPPEPPKWDVIRYDLEREALKKEKAGDKDGAAKIRKFAADLPKRSGEQ